MVVDVTLYLPVHQPRRLKLPAQPIPRYASIEDITRCLFNDRLNEYYFRHIAQVCYYPATRILLELVRKQSLRLALGISLSFVQQAERWEPALLDLFRELVAEEGVELVGTDPFHSLHCLIDLPAFATRMSWMADEMLRLFGKRPTVTDTTEMCMSASIYDALDTAGFRGAFLDGDPQIMQWRASTYLYRYNDEQPVPAGIQLAQPPRRPVKRGPAVPEEAPAPVEKGREQGLALLTRHRQLSADVAERFTQSSWPAYPLYADAYARWIALTDGDFVLLNWDFEHLGEHHSHSTGIFEFIQALPGELARHGITMRTPGEVIDRYATKHIYHLPLPVHPPTWSTTLGLEPTYGYAPQHELFELLRDIYNLARLTENPALLELATWLMQADHFRLAQHPGYQLTDMAPQEWRRLGPAEILREQRQVYLNALSAFEPYLPARLLRQVQKKPVARISRRKTAAAKPKAGSTKRSS